MTTDRKKGIGGTDISAIVGLNPWKTPLDVFLEKTGQKEDQPDNENMWWGREMEPVLAKRYCKEKDISENLLVLPPALKNPIKHQGLSWYIGSPDGLIPSVFPKQAMIVGGVDFKTSGKPSEWGEPGTDEIPEQYIIQAEWYMGLTGAQWWDIAVLLMGFTRKFAIYRVNRDDELIENLTDAGAKFWTDHVLANITPELDGSKSATEYVKRLYPRDSGPMLEPTDAEILTLVDAYRDAREKTNGYEKLADTYENRLKAFVGDCGGMQGGWGRITWRKAKDSSKIDWKEAFYDLTRVYETNPAEIDTIIAGYTTIKPGSRRWLPKFKED